MDGTTSNPIPRWIICLLLVPVYILTIFVIADFPSLVSIFISLFLGGPDLGLYLVGGFLALVVVLVLAGLTVSHLMTWRAKSSVQQWAMSRGVNISGIVAFFGGNFFRDGLTIRITIFSILDVVAFLVGLLLSVSDPTDSGTWVLVLITGALFLIPSGFLKMLNAWFSNTQINV
ncbi:MAG: hypothetical protein NUW37_19390 [Planctomycetes bacterium]|nr:hypothetical protein [Planctomycetota bacterium]